MRWCLADGDERQTASGWAAMMRSCGRIDERVGGRRCRVCRVAAHDEEEARAQVRAWAKCRGGLRSSALALTDANRLGCAQTRAQASWTPSIWTEKTKQKTLLFLASAQSKMTTRRHTRGAARRIQFFLLSSILTPSTHIKSYERGRERADANWLCGGGGDERENRVCRSRLLQTSGDVLNKLADAATCFAARILDSLLIRARAFHSKARRPILFSGNAPAAASSCCTFFCCAQSERSLVGTKKS